MMPAILAAAFYLLLTIAALLSTVSPLLSTLSSHGKTRTRTLKHKPGDTHDITGVPGLFLSLLTSDILSVNKRRFIDFYMSGIIATILLVRARAKYDSYATVGILTRGVLYRWLPTSLMMLHLIRRCCECIWVQKSRKSSQMHLAGYLLGVVHYLCLPFVFVPPPFFTPANSDNHCIPPFDRVGCSSEMAPARECGMNTSLYEIQYTCMEKLVVFTATIGCLYFQYQQHRHHVILANLRSTKRKVEYFIPMEGWFEYVSCPHYFLEIMIYVTFATLSSNAPSIRIETGARASVHQFKNHLASFLPRSWVPLMTAIYSSKHWILLVWVLTNLSISATRTHDWYLHNYGTTYPQQRKRLFPHVW